MKVRLNGKPGRARAELHSVLYLLPLLLLGFVTGCGAPGAPLPPSLELPRPVQDLTASRKGDKVTLKWTVPVQTTDGQNLRSSDLGPAQVCRAIATFPMLYCTQLAGEIPAGRVPLAKPGGPPKTLVFTDTLSQPVESQHPTELVTYAVAMLNSRGRSGGLSNQVRVPLAPVLPPPAQIQTEVTADGIVLTFPCPPVPSVPELKHDWLVFRRMEGTPGTVPVVELPGSVSSSGGVCRAVDSSFEWDKTYYYHVTPVTTVIEHGTKVAEVEGENSPEVRVVATDVFPPAVPTGLEAVYSGAGQKPFIDLTWAPDTARDLAGYNVYRHEQGRGPAKINSKLVPTPSFRDENVQPGRTYYYSVSAVDLRGNESAQSRETSERVP